MGKAQVLSEDPIDLAELKEEITRIKARDKEPSFRAGKLEEYLNTFTVLEPKVAESVKDKIRKLNVPRLREEHIKKIVDLMPVNTEQLKVVLQGYTITVNQDNLKKIVGVLKTTDPSV